MRLREPPEVARTALIPDREERELGLALVGDLERQLRPAGSRPARSSPAHSRRGRRAGALEPRQLSGRLGAEREHVPALRHLGPAGKVLGWLARQGAHHEHALALAGEHRHERAEAVGVGQPGEHCRVGLEVAEARQQDLDRLGDPRVGGHAPVLASPVEPASQEALHRLVQILVERIVEDRLRLARVVGEQGDPAPWERAGRLGRIGRQTSETTARASDMHRPPALGLLGAYAWRPRDGDRTESGGGLRSRRWGSTCCGSGASWKPAAGGGSRLAQRHVPERRGDRDRPERPRGCRAPRPCQRVREGGCQLRGRLRQHRSRRHPRARYPGDQHRTCSQAPPRSSRSRSCLQRHGGSPRPTGSFAPAAGRPRRRSSGAGSLVRPSAWWASDASPGVSPSFFAASRYGCCSPRAQSPACDTTPSAASSMTSWPARTS